MGEERAQGQEPSELGIEVLPIAIANLRAELTEARDLARRLEGETPAQVNRLWCDQLAEEYHDAGAGQAAMAAQLEQWRRTHPDAVGLDELAELVAEVEPVRQALLRQLARLRSAE
ncbi:hypothetical protein [Lentzea jiangxiensis]|uniref:hypothetical protein n=1 Tax=Lentzea jiangxiensis TaxID=641025 RepID=UPI000B7C6DD8|nr:hypothetical protein [Lentzea jiangxiensis]